MNRVSLDDPASLTYYYYYYSDTCQVHAAPDEGLHLYSLYN